MTSLEKGFATIKADENIYSIFGEKLILRNQSETIAGGIVLNPIIDPMNKNQKTKLLSNLVKRDFKSAFKVLLDAHKKGLGVISSTQRFALSHEEALEFAKNLNDVFIDEKELVIYPNSTKNEIEIFIKNIYNKNQYALLSASSIALRASWASLGFIQEALNDLVRDGFLKKEENLYKSANIKEDIKKDLEDIFLNRLKIEDLSPTAPYNIYDELDIDRKLGDDILKSLTAKKQVIRLQHNLFIHFESLNKAVKTMKDIIKKDGFKFGFDPNGCNSCKGNCCIGESGYIWINAQEMQALAIHLNLSIEELPLLSQNSLKV